MAARSVPTTLQPGSLVKIRSLKSEAGKELNGQRGVIICFLESEGRYQIRVESEKTMSKTWALKPDNLSLITKRLPLPTGPNRGLADPSSMETMVPKLCELLVYQKSGEFTPSEIMFGGYGAMAFNRMGQHNFMYFTCVHLEQMGGVLGLGNICQMGEEFGTANVLFSLLEGDIMYLDVLIQTMTWTRAITSGELDMETDHAFMNCPPTKLTPDQDTKPYVKTMAEGPVLILEQMAEYNFAPAFWAALSKSEFYHLLIHRLLRWVAREGQDGRVLGKKARKILSSMFPDCADRLSKPIKDDEECASILEKSANLLLKPEDVSVEQLTLILG